jgi:hypothetical protein
MLTVTQYEKAIQTLSKRRREILTLLYEVEPIADNKLVANALKYKNHNAVNLHVGNIGKAISLYHNLKPDFIYEYKGVDTVGYFSIVHQYDGDKWDMVENLRKAMKNLKWITSKS